MMKEISDNMLAAFLEGNTNSEETMQVLDAAMRDAELRRVIELSMEMDAEDELESAESLPLQAMAARERENRCAVMCELYILALYNIDRTLEDCEAQASQQGWLKDEGTSIHDIGRLLEQESFQVCRTFHNSLKDLKRALQNGHVIAVVDGKELTTNITELNREHLEDDFIGANPNHAVVVTGIENGRVTYYDPDKDGMMTISTGLFMDAWEDSSNYMVKVSRLPEA